MDEVFGTKELYSVVLKTTYDIGDFKTGEIIASFDNIQIGGLDQIKTLVSARGGYGNPGLVVWENTKEINLNFSQGVFSKEQLSILTNSKLVNKASDTIELCQEEKLTVSNSQITLTYQPNGEAVVYNLSTGSKTYNTAVNKVITTSLAAGTEVLVRYNFNYTSSDEILTLGNSLFNGFISLEGRMRLKDDSTGHTVTGIIKIPKLKLMSGLSMRLGRNANPFVADFKGVGYPVGSRGAQSVCDLYILPDDIDSDI